MADPAASRVAAPVVDLREVPESALRGPDEFEAWQRDFKPSSHAGDPPARDLYAFEAGPVVSREPLIAPPFSHHLVILVKIVGHMEMRFAGLHAQGPVTPGMACLMPANLPSEWRAASGVARSTNLFISPQVLASVAAEALEIDPACAWPRSIPFFEDDFLTQVGAIVSALTHTSDLCDRLYLESLGHTTAMHFLCHYVDFPVTPCTVRGRLPPATLRQVNDYIASQPNSELTLARIASLAHLSPYHFARLFKETTGQTVHAYVLEQRLLHSCYLLLSTRLPISYIALEAGFADESHFVRRFKDQFGVTPGTVRRSLLS